MRSPARGIPALLAAVALGALAAGAALADETPGLTIHPLPPGGLFYTMHNDAFTVRVRKPGGPWRDLYEYTAKVDSDGPSDVSVVQFDFTGPVEIGVRKNNGDFKRVEVRPASNAIRSKVEKGIVTFTIDKPQNLSVEFDGDRLHNLLIFAGAPIARPAPGPDVVFYEPGLHTPPGGGQYFPVKSGQTIYVAGGAVLQGTFKPEGVENVRILGRGIIDRPAEQLVVQNSRNVTVEGLTFLTPKHGTIACASSSNVTFRDFRTLSNGSWSDGVNVFACSDVTVERAFIRTSDDSVAVYATRKDGKGDTRRVRVRDSIFWPDVAHAVFIGLHGDSEKPNVLEDLRFENIDILGLDEDDPEYQGALAISAGDTNTVRDVVFDGIRVDQIEEGKLFNVRTVFNAKYGTSPGLLVDGVVFRNIDFTGDGWPSPSTLSGYGPDRPVKNISFENVTIGGKRLKAADPSVIEIGPNVEGVSFK
ncbi:glycoside hydrolase [Caulobacter sp. D4A]|uniref:glycosyl hydrolase family 28 protein n=1 Tax=unclassified Caulobacter TaxID=2648921 RepID=UPI000D73F6C1|nr:MULTISPECIES: glycosyl hydrolase family 28 protein [unclassified Caulobacter]PXA90672.1 glycoside hydrolase [Caulobacter sp. D4A]PXA95563.1 glycoside hydrolase [Caulobacter sp. D5]